MRGLATWREIRPRLQSGRQLLRAASTSASGSLLSAMARMTYRQHSEFPWGSLWIGNVPVLLPCVHALGETAMGPERRPWIDREASEHTGW